MSEEPRDLNLMDRMIPMKGGKEYLQVADRIVWFRRDYPEGTIETKLLELDRDKGFAMYHARITTGKGGVAEASGSETAKDFGDYIEKSETKAVGRALGYLGFGTASAGFEEGPRVVDTPRPANQPARPARTPSPSPDPRPAAAPQGGGPPPPAPEPPYTDREFNAIIDKAWEWAEDGWTLEDIRNDLNKLRHRMSKQQRKDTLAALEKIEARRYPPPAIAG